MGLMLTVVKNVITKKNGHRDNATFENKMGGSTYYCPPTATNNDT